jgi:hypothetical protein
VKKKFSGYILYSEKDMILPLSDIIKYIVEGLAVSVCAYLIAGKKSDLQSIALLGLSAAVTFLILDLFTAGMGASVRQGAGFGLGVQTVGYPAGEMAGLGALMGEGFMSEGFDSDLGDQGVDLNQPYYRALTNDKEDLSAPPVDYLGDTPYRFPNSYAKNCPQKPVGDVPITAPFAQTKGKSRWMGWVEDSPPINTNTADYKIIPGLYAALALQPGYHEGVQPSNEDKESMMAPTMWPTQNPLDKAHFKHRQA